jgi:hypothetical protein
VAQLTFPKAQDSDSIGAQSSLDLGIALLVAGQLLAPVWAIRFGYVAASGAAMPEASVDKYRDALSRKEKIRAARSVL